MCHSKSMKLHSFIFYQLRTDLLLQNSEINLIIWTWQIIVSLHSQHKHKNLCCSQSNLINNRNWEVLRGQRQFLHLNVVTDKTAKTTACFLVFSFLALALWNVDKLSDSTEDCELQQMHYILNMHNLLCFRHVKHFKTLRITVKTVPHEQA